MEQVLINNGLPGIIILALGWVVMRLYNRQESRQTIIEKDLRSLRDKFDKYLDEDRKEMLETIRSNTDACRELHDIIREKI